MEKYHWKEIYTIPFKYTREPYLQSLQYKINNQILNTTDKLEKWFNKEINKCNYCQTIDSLDHDLYQCGKSKTVLDKVEN